MKKYHIGDVAAIKTDNPVVNPYHHDGLMGKPRKDALKAFKHGRDTKGVVFWLKPAIGGAKPVTSPDEIDWSASSIA